MRWRIHASIASRLLKMRRGKGKGKGEELSVGWVGGWFFARVLGSRVRVGTVEEVLGWVGRGRGRGRGIGEHGSRAGTRSALLCSALI